MTNLAKLDSYPYYILPGIISIELERSNDPIQVDILSEIDRSNGRIYLDGNYYITTGNECVNVRGKWYLDLKVTLTA